MDQVAYLRPIAGDFTRFSLSITDGTLSLDDAGGLEIYARRRSDSGIFPVSAGESLQVDDIFATEMYVLNPNDSGGVAETRFTHATSAGSEEFSLTTVVAKVQVDCDADRDGNVGDNEEGKANWVWGPEGRGAIVLVDNDRDPAGGATGVLEEREPLVIRDTGLESLPDGVSLRLRSAPEGAMKFSIFREAGSASQKIMGKDPRESIQYTIAETADLALSGETLLVAAHEYPGPFFEGLLIINLELVHAFNGGERVLASDRVMYRVAPWVMTPNTQAAEHIYTCKITNGPDNNTLFLEGLQKATAAEGLPLEIIPESISRGDRWIQDEIEIGYSRSHRGTLPVVFDSPRDRGLDEFPEIRLLGTDFGHFVIGGGVPNSLDSFGNLEVSPPVVVDGQSYPLGRVVVGGRRSGDYQHSSRQMMAEIRQFLYAQKVQFPFEIYTDWLSVAHVDEIVCFVPSSSGQGFKVLVADTDRVKEILEELSDKGHGSVLLFEGKTRLDGSSAEITVDDLLGDTTFWEGNAVYQDYMRANIEILKSELAVTDADIVRVPTCFQVSYVNGQLERTLAFFPDMVNHVVHNDLSIVPKPYGPIVDGKCAFEKAFEDSLPDRRVVFIDDWYSYHELSGEVHCGTNAKRKPFGVSRWWNVLPEGGFDIKTTGFLDD
ncbi:protein-arginine deiminase family protein [Ruegeria sp. HKCCD8929]|uniref:protein-arginine deiminase family protein n=1 Tax=Ruegeria sp. HKCCD8929 TaxID=2683006 RepID=UPI0014894F60|nr:protein-arginine deiminase family protein [Ruegeria sp. HKCCD8929]